jgi:hypothetical protein
MLSTVSWAAKVKAAAERPNASRDPSFDDTGQRDPRVANAHQQQHSHMQQHEQPYQGYIGMRHHAQGAASAIGAVGAAPLRSLHSTSATTSPQQQQQNHYLNGALGGLALPPHHLGMLGLSLGSSIGSSEVSSSAIRSSAAKTAAAAVAAATVAAAAVADFGEELPAQFGQHLPLEQPTATASGSEAKEDLLGTFPCVELRGLALETSVRDVLDFFVGLGPVLDIVLQPMDVRRTAGGAPAAEAVVLFGNVLDYRGALQVSIQQYILH